MADNAEWGPLAGLIGEWEGDDGLDLSWHNVEGELGETPYREKVSMKPFGPVDNGTQHLYGLDYRMAAWRGDEENPFHTEVGYWLWDAADGRGDALLHGAARLDADRGRQRRARATRRSRWRRPSAARCTGSSRTSTSPRRPAPRSTRAPCTIDGDGTWSYDECTTYDHAIGGEIAHTDRNTLRRVGTSRAQSRVIGVVSRPSRSTVVRPARNASKNLASFASRA